MENRKKGAWKGKIQIKAIATAVYVLSLLLILAGIGGIVAFAAAGNPSEKELLAMADRKLTAQAANRYLFEVSSDESEESLKGLEGGPLDYELVKTSDGKETVLYKSADFKGDRETCDFVLTGGSDYEYNFYTSDFFGMLLESGYNYQRIDESVESAYSASDIVYGTDNLYYAYFGPAGYLRVDAFTVEEETSEDYTETEYHYDEKTNTYLNADKQAFDLQATLNGLPSDIISYSVNFIDSGYDIINSYLTEFNNGEREVTELTAVPITSEDLVDPTAYHYDDDGIIYGIDNGDEEGDTYTLCITYHADINDNSYADDESDGAFYDGTPIYYVKAAEYIDFAGIYQEMDIFLLIIGILLFIPAITVLCMTCGHRKDSDEIVLRWYDRLPYFLYFCLSVGLIFGFAAANVGLVYLLEKGALGLWEDIVLNVICYMIWSLLLLDFLLSLIVRIKAGKFWRYTLCYYISRPIAACHRYLQGHMGFFWKCVAVLGGLSILELIVIACTQNHPAMEIWLFLLYKLVEIPVLLWMAAQLKHLFLSGERVAKGDYSQPVSTKGMLFDFKKHGENLNHVSDGISLAVDERMKSEHFQTELITNVSHDIKTPLTSIINYTDLLKKLDVADPTEKEYIEVLDRQSARLKTLIEDLIEASKASSGALSVNMEKIDAVVMLDQVVGEFEEKLNKQGLSVVVNKPEPPVTVLADGRHFWRILDNLMGNICKYAQPGTRVYVDLAKENGWVHMTFRNISREQLNISSEELMQRFVRGDSSRNTEGNGLGLNIASSLATLMGGNMAVQIDGDLFKVNLFFPEADSAVTHEEA